MAQELVLYSYWRSSAAYRVRIALNLKQLPYEVRPVHLVRDGGEQHQERYRKLNPQELVPVLMDGQRVLRQSLAIIEYLEEAYPQEVSLLPAATRDRAHARALAQLVACDVHPVGNLRVLQYLQKELGVADGEREAWSRHWIREGFDALEALLAESTATGRFCVGDTPGLADICLVPQIYNARRWGVPVEHYPQISRIEAECAALPAFQQAAPEQQPDAPEAAG